MTTEKKDRPEAKLEPKTMKIKVTFQAPLLGTSPADPDIYETFIGGKSADKEKVKAEIAGLSQDELAEKGKTVFHRTDDGLPMLYDYQIKGMIKEAFSVMTEFGDIKTGAQKISKYNVKRVVDNFIFVYPREIPLRLPEGGAINECVRPLRAQTMKGERISLACSERAPKGTTCECTVEWLHPSLEKHVIAALEYGAKKGIGQWRNSGMGRYTFEVLHHG
jgi:hypothetical protein